MPEFKEKYLPVEEPKKASSPTMRKARGIVLGLAGAVSAIHPSNVEANQPGIESSVIDSMFADVYSSEEKQQIKEYMKESIQMARKLVNERLPNHKDESYFREANRLFRNYAHDEVERIKNLSLQLGDKDIKNKVHVPANWDKDDALDDWEKVLVFEAKEPTAKKAAAAEATASTIKQIKEDPLSNLPNIKKQVKDATEPKGPLSFME